MKQILKLCLTFAVLCMTLNADADISLEKTLQMKSEGKASSTLFKTHGSDKAIKTIRKGQSNTRHDFSQRIKADTNPKKLSSKVNAMGDNIFGYLSYSIDYDQRPGLYEFINSGVEKIWEDPVYPERYIAASSLSLQDMVLKGYSIDASYGGYVIFGVYYVEYSFETGENLTFRQQEGSTSSFMQCIALDAADGLFYGYGKYEDEPAFLSAPVNDPFNYTLISYIADTEDACLSLCLNTDDNCLYGVNGKYEFVRISKDGTQSVVMNLDIEDGGSYNSGLVYNPASQLYYWNLIRFDESSAMATINPAENKFDIYEELYNREQFKSLFTTDEKVEPLQPKRPTAGEARFPEGTLTGTVTFTLPTELYSGETINEEIEYETFVDDTPYSTGNGTAGAEIAAEFAVSQGMHTFGLKAKVAGYESSIATLNAYVGHDNPLAPENVVFTGSEVTWDASSPDNTGFHGGYVDSKDIFYHVALNDQVIGTTSATSMCVRIPDDAELSLFNVEVVAECNGFVSLPSYSNSIVGGNALKVPQYFMPTPEEFELSTIVDNNEDEISWALQYDWDTDDYYLQTGFSAEGEKMDDWYFLPKMMFDDSSRYYSFSMEVALGDSFYSNEYVEVFLCSEPDPKSVITPAIIEEFAPASDDFQEALGHFKVNQPGVYYIGIHCTSDGDQFGLKARNFYVEDNNITLNSPQAPTNLQLEAVEKGRLEATVTFDMPTLRMNGTAISADTRLTAGVTCVDEVKVEGLPGETVSVVVKTEQGDNRITVVVNDGVNNGPAVNGTVFTGVHLPSPVESLIAESEPDMMSMRLEWEPVTTGWISEDDPEGGIVVAEEIVYDIYKATDEEYDDYDYEEGLRGWTLIESGVTENSYTYSTGNGAPQELVELCVVPRNELGANYFIEVTVSDIVGTPYSLPIKEDWDETGDFNTSPWLTYDVAGIYEHVGWGLWYTSEVSEKYEDLETISLVAQGWAGAAGMLGTPRFTTIGCESASITMNICGDFKLPKITILAQTYGKDPVEIGEVSLTPDQKGFNKVETTIPSEYLGKDWVGLFIQAEFAEDYEALVVENLAIEKNIGTSVISATGNNVNIIGGKDCIKVYGLNGEIVTISTLDGKILTKETTAGSSTSFRVDKGVYIVTVGSRSTKVIVK